MPYDAENTAFVSKFRVIPMVLLPVVGLTSWLHPRTIVQLRVFPYLLGLTLWLYDVTKPEVVLLNCQKYTTSTPRTPDRARGNL